MPTDFNRAYEEIASQDWDRWSRNRRQSARDKTPR